jgi:hypothetical protein
MLCEDLELEFLLLMGGSMLPNCCKINVNYTKIKTKTLFIFFTAKFFL